MIRVEGLVKKGHNMAKLFNNNNNTTVNQSQETEQQSNKLGWLKTGALVISGAAATVGAVIGARKLYEHFTALDGELDGDQFEEDPETDQDQLTTPDSEADTEPSIFTADIEKDPAGETPESIVDSEEPTDVVPGTIDPHDGSCVLPDGKSWRSLVRPEIFEIFKDLESSLNKLDFNESPYVARCAASIFERAADVKNVSEWEQRYIDNELKDFYAYIESAMDDIADRYMKTHQSGDLMLANSLYNEFVNSPLCTFGVGRKLNSTLKRVTDDAEKQESGVEETFPTFGLPMLEAYMHNAYMHYSKLDMEFLKNSDPRYVAKVFYSNMNRIIKSNPGDSEVLDTENGILVPFSVVAVELYNGLTVNLEVDLQSDPGNKSIINRIFELQTEAHEFYDDLMAHYGNNESYLETIIENPFNGTEDTVKVILKSLMDEMDARCKNLRSEEQDEGSSGEAVAVAAENETAATTEAPVVKEELSESSSAADNTAALEKFRKDMDFLNGLLDSVRMSDAQKFFRENLASYITDQNVSEETRNGLAQIQEKITNFLIAEKQAAAIEEANNCSRRSSRKRGGKKNYKKNGRK